MTSDLSPAISVRRLSKSFSVPRLKARGERPADPRRRPAGWRDRFDVLRDLTFEIPRGQAVGVIGPNGSGKTTLLKILAGVMNADSGEMKIGGRVGALLEVGAGFHPDLAGEENVQLNGALLGISRAEMSRHLAEIIAFAGLERYMDMPVRHYSSGMIVRLGFATAIQLRPDILLLDETFAVGDAEFQGKAFRRIREMKSAGVTMMLVSHNAEQLLQLADRVIWIDK
ncbi:ABC transporter ATP-binding protein, partial [Candidatus Sumerlaeota bacterium]|nr:ABC transporter ATP-binding protein [Candidatus Sumerlaeota bacterium]